MILEFEKIFELTKKLSAIVLLIDEIHDLIPQGKCNNLHQCCRLIKELFDEMISEDIR